MFGEAGGVNNEVDLRVLFLALPESHGVVDQIDARAALGDYVGANDFVEMDAHFGRGVGHGEAGEVGILFQAAPVALVGKCFAAGDAQRGEDAPAQMRPACPGERRTFSMGSSASL